MDRIHDRANKFINDVRKKKIKVCKNMYKDNKELTKHDAKHILDVSNICPYCQKVFFHSRFLVRHVLRRHSDDLILLHNKCSKYECNNNSSDLKCLFSFLEEEFSMLKNELVMVKKAVAGKNVNIDYTEASKGEKNTDFHGNVSSASENKAIVNDDANELKILKGNMCDREAVQCLHNKYEELCNVLKNEVVMKEDINEFVSFNNENILRAQELKYEELRQIILEDLQTMLSKHENNTEWKSHISELKHEMKKLDCVIDDVKKQVYSPDYVKTLTEKFEETLIYSLNGTKHKCRKSRNSKSKSIISETGICCQPEENIVVESDKHGTKTFRSIKHGQVPVIPMSPTLLSHMIAEKLSYFQIAPNSSKISCAEFEEKLKLINSEKERLSKRYPNFSEIYNKIDVQAEHKVSKLQNKRSRKIRFSEPLSTNRLHDSISVEKNSKNKTYPFQQSEVEHFTAAKNPKISEHKGQDFTTFLKQKNIPDSEGFTFTDVGGSGDYTWIPDNQNYATKDTFKSTVTSMSGFKTSSPIEDIRISRRTKNTYNLNDSNCASSAPSSFSKTLDCAVVETKKNTVRTLKDHAERNEKYLLPNNLTSDEAEDCNKPVMDYIDNNSPELESLSSWDDEDNLH